MANRRTFLMMGGAALASPASRAQTGTLSLGLIGCGWYGMVDLNAAFENDGVQCAALCDVDSEHLAAAAAEVEKRQGKRPATHKDYRELLDTPGLDAVIIATPPQWHALQFIDACRKKLAVYCEKPLSYDVREGQAMVRVWKEAGNIVQIGFQRRQTASFQAARDYIRSGAPGRIIQVDVNIHYTAQMLDATPQDPPQSLDWDAWCGPAPKLPYSPNIGHKSWRLEAAYGNGHLVDWGIHLIDAARVVMGLAAPKSVVAAGGLYYLKDRITTPDTLTAHFEFDPCPVVWRHRLWGAAEYDPEVANGVFFFGAKETVFASDRRWVIVPKGKDAVKKVMAAGGPDNPGVTHMREFLNAVRSRSQPSCSPEDAWRSTAAVQLGMISYQTKSRVEWDPVRFRIPSNREAEAMLLRPYRPPYRHPYEG